MSGVDTREYVRHRFEWVLPMPSEGVAIGDIRDAISMATGRWHELTGYVPQVPHTEDWLRVSYVNGELVFSFEMNEDGAP